MTFVQLNAERRYATTAPVGYLVQANGCWEWVGQRNQHGYGRLWVNGRKCLAHRVLYERARGSIPAGLTLDHLCRRPSCVNPDHLEAVSHRENCLRGQGPTAANARKSHCPHGHPLAGDNLVSSALAVGRRKCRTCHNARNRTYYHLRRLPGEPEPT